MSIGSQIKKRRHELNMSQENLAEKLGVSRSAVSNWEIERNYPDLQLIVTLSNTLNISLDALLKEDEIIVEKITNDTRQRKKLNNKIKFLYIFIIIMFIALCIILFNTRFLEISNSNQIKTAQLKGDELVVTVDIPKYRSLSDYYIDWDDNGKTVNISLVTKRDFTFCNTSALVLPITLNETPEKISFTHNGEILKNYDANDIIIN